MPDLFWLISAKKVVNGEKYPNLTAQQIRIEQILRLIENASISRLPVKREGASAAPVWLSLLRLEL